MSASEVAACEVDSFAEPAAPEADSVDATERNHAPAPSFRDRLVKEIPNLRAFAASLSGSLQNADDLVQDTLLKAWANAASFQHGTNLRAWLFTILRNTYYSIYRKRGREVEDKDGAYSERLATPASQDGVVDLADFRLALARLPEEQREALIMIGATGLSYEEAAAIAEVAVGTIKSRVNRARARLAELLGIADGSELGPDPKALSALGGAAAI
jgi:RNA polymerase sigma-70 factor, ECF subfamily